MKTTIKYLKWSLMCLIMTAGLISCEEDDPKPDPDPINPAPNGVLILSEGGYNANNASLTYYNPETNETKNVFNGTLGDLAQDMIVYGNKLYITVTGSSNITVVDINTLQELEKIRLFTNEVPQSPRYLASYDGKVYATCYDGNVVRLDTASLQIDGTTSVGAYPEGIAAYRGKLYVANSDNRNPDGVGNTLSVVDIATFKEERKLTVGLNPFFVKADNVGNIFLSCQGDLVTYATTGCFQQINPDTYTVTTIADYPKQTFSITDQAIYYADITYFIDWTSSFSLGVYDIAQKEFLSRTLITDETTINTPYAVAVNPNSKEVYISNTDSYTDPGKVYIFSPDGKKIKEISVGINPNNILFF